MSKVRGAPKGRFNSPEFGFVGIFMGERRVKLGLGLQDVANKMRVRVQFVSNIEHGRAPLPYNRVELAAKALKVSPKTLSALAIQDYVSFKRHKYMSNKNRKERVK